MEATETPKPVPSSRLGIRGQYPRRRRKQEVYYLPEETNERNGVMGGTQMGEVETEKGKGRGLLALKEGEK